MGSGTDVLLMDDFLPQPRWEDVWSYAIGCSMGAARGRSISKAFRLYEGEPLQGDAYSFLHDADGLTAPTGVGGVRAAAPACLADVAARLNADARVASFVRGDGRWDLTVVRPYIYPPGAGLAWHTDGSAGSVDGVRHRKIGAFILYCHPVWHSQWGGELLIGGEHAGCEPANVDTPLGDYGLFDRLYSKQLDSLKDGVFYSPKPNRLLLIRPNVQHAIKKVEAAAGLAFRASLAGFFIEAGQVRAKD